uniref:C2H2-type domain-containing protein n=1 Tax=Acrobeloides nanus TaxID=290746 RepID=A0A914CUR0_9BILA
MSESKEISNKRAHTSTLKTTPIVKVENRDDSQENVEEASLKRIRTSPPGANNNLFCLIQCQLCGFPFMDVASLQAHTITVHT